MAVKAAIGNVKEFLEPAERLVFGPEIVSPLRDAVRLINRDIIRPARGQCGHERLIGESFRRDIEKTEAVSWPRAPAPTGARKGEHGRANRPPGCPRFPVS